MSVKLCECGGQTHRTADGYLRCKVCGERADTDDMAVPLRQCTCKEPDKEMNTLGGIYLWHCKKCNKGGELANVVNFPNANVTAPLGISLYDLGKVEEGELMVFDKEQGCVRGRKDAGIHPIAELADKVKRKAKQEEIFAEVKDSGERRETVTGAVRDRAKGKGRYDLLSFIGIHRVAVHYENGARKYKDRNWEKGMPLSWFIDSGLRHYFAYLSGDRSEDHMAAVAWNALGYMHIEEMIRRGKLPKELDDIGATDRPLIDTGETYETKTNPECNQQVQSEAAKS